MLRDGYFALHEFAEYQREREQVEARISSGYSITDIDVESLHANKDGRSPIESIKQREFEPLGSIIHPFWYTVLHGIGNLRLAQQEVKRWERSITFLSNEQLPEVFETAVIGNVLEIACGMLTTENIHDIRHAVSSLFQPLTSLSEFVVRTSADYDNVHYAIARALLRMCKAMVEGGLSGLSHVQQDYVKDCLELAKLFILHTDNEAMLDQGDSYDEISDEDESRPVANFRHLISSRCPAELFNDNQTPVTRG